MTQKQKQNLQISQNFKKMDWLIKSGQKIRLNIHLFNKGLVALIIVMSLFFVFSINDLAIKGFVLQEIKNKTEEVQNENDHLALRVMELESYENLSKRAVDIKMVKVGQIDYLSVTDASVAKK